MKDKITCEQFSDRLDDFVSGRSEEKDAASTEAHLASCDLCREMFEMKKVLKAESPSVPDTVETELLEAVMSDVAAARETGRAGRSWTSRYLMPAMAAAIVIFVFLTGFMLGEIRGLHREAGELREEVSVMETVLAGKMRPTGSDAEGRSVFGRMSGSLPASSGMTVGEAARFLESLPADTPVLTEEEAKDLISGNRRLRRLAGYIDERPWEGGLTSGELLLVIVALDIDPGTKIPDELRRAKDGI